MARKKPIYRIKDKPTRLNFEGLFRREPEKAPAFPLVRPKPPVEVGTYYFDPNSSMLYVYGASGWMSTTLS